MANIGSLIGTAGGAGGTGFSGPGAASISNPTNGAQIQGAYNNVQGAQNQQQSLLAALQAQNGLQNQTNVYNQTQGVANGTGPNPAQTMLNQATGANVANQAALMAGQRGAGANAGLIARQAAQQGANTQQQAASQAATMQSQQQLNALNSLSGQANTMAGNQIGQTNANTSAQQAEQSALINAQLGVNNANVSSQGSINASNAGLANTQLQGQQALQGGLMNSIGGGASSMMKAAAEGGDVEDLPSNEFSSNTAGVTPGNAPSVPSPTFGADSGAAALGQGAGSLGGGGGSSGGSSGGGLSSLLALLADGGPVPDSPAPSNGPKSKFGQFLKGAVKPGQGSGASSAKFGNPGTDALYQGASGLGNSIGQGLGSLMKGGNSTPAPQTVAGGPMDNSGDQTQPAMDDSNTMMAAKGGKVPALVSPGEQYLPPKDVKKVVKEGKNPLQVGERIPGKPKHPGNDYRNDTVPKTLESGGMVIPNKVMQSRNPHFEAMKFVHAHIAKNRKGLK